MISEQLPLIQGSSWKTFVQLMTIWRIEKWFLVSDSTWLAFPLWSVCSRFFVNCSNTHYTVRSVSWCNFFGRERCTMCFAWFNKAIQISFLNFFWDIFHTLMALCCPIGRIVWCFASNKLVCFLESALWSEDTIKVIERRQRNNFVPRGNWFLRLSGPEFFNYVF